MGGGDFRGLWKWDKTRLMLDQLVLEELDVIHDEEESPDPGDLLNQHLRNDDDRYNFAANLQDALAESLDLDATIRVRDIAACNTVADLCDKVADLLRQQGIEVITH